MRLGSWIRRHRFVTAIVVVAAIGAGIGAYQLQQSSRARKHWRQAEEAIAARDFARAQAELGRYLELRPESAEAHFLLAQACRRARAEDFDGAKAHLAEARRLHLSQPGISLEFDLLEFQQSGKRDEHERRLLQLLSDPAIDRRLVLEALARGCIRGERLEEAVAWLDRWVESYPDDWFAYFVRGTLFQHMDKPAPAVADLERVLQLKPDIPDINLRLGLAHVQSGSDYPRALRLLEDYRQNHADHIDAVVGIARCKCVLNDPKGARELLLPIVVAKPEHVDALQALAVAEMDLEIYPAALKHLRQLEPLAASPPVEESFQKLLRLEPTADSRSIPNRLEAVYHMLATVYRRLGATQEAEVYDRKLEEHAAAVKELLSAAKEHSRNPNDVDLWYKMGTLNLRVGIKDTGEYWLNRVLQANPNDRRAHGAIAGLYRSRPDPESQRKADLHEQRAGSEK